MVVLTGGGAAKGAVIAPRFLSTVSPSTCGLRMASVLSCSCCFVVVHFRSSANGGLNAEALALRAKGRGYEDLLIEAYEIRVFFWVVSSDVTGVKDGISMTSVLRYVSRDRGTNKG